MFGEVIFYSEEKDEGIISSLSGELYKFKKKDWVTNGNVLLNASVDYAADGDCAREIHCLSNEETIKKNEENKLKADAKNKQKINDATHSTKTDNFTVSPSNNHQGIYRSSSNKIFMGVCAGLSHKWVVPAFIIRAVPLLIAISIYVAYELHKNQIAFALYCILTIFVGFYFYIGLFSQQDSTK